MRITFHVHLRKTLETSVNCALPLMVKCNVNFLYMIWVNSIRNGFRVIALFVILTSNVGCDQLSKSIARSSIESGEKVSVIADYLVLTQVENRGAFLSLGDELPGYLNITLLQVLPAFILLAALIFLFRNERLNSIVAVSLAFILGGGIGNLYDRITSGSVTDFIFRDFYLFRTGIFNMADVSIMIGALVLMYLNLRGKPMLKH